MIWICQVDKELVKFKINVLEIKKKLSRTSGPNSKKEQPKSKAKEKRVWDDQLREVNQENINKFNQ
jgi:hypothetical protein